MAFLRFCFAAASIAFTAVAAENLACPDYSVYSTEHHGPYSSGRYNLSYQRPVTRCRTFNSSIVEETINSTLQKISDPDLQRLFLNSFPNTLDTAVKWKGYAKDSPDEELVFLITGDINAVGAEYTTFRIGTEQLRP